MRTYAVLRSLCSSLLCSSLPPLSVLLPRVQFNIGAERSSRVFLWARAISGGTKKGLHELVEVPKAHHQVAMVSIPPPEVVRGCPKGTTAVAEALQQEEMVRPPVPEPSLECPRCESIDTNFCYYNNYSLSQPRYFCKGCRRHWTKGGSLRIVPVGGGCRNNKKSSSSRGARGQQAFDTDSTPPLCNALLPSLLAIASLQKQQSAHQAFLLGNPTPEPGWSAGCPDIPTTAFLDGTGDPSGFLYSINRGGYGDADSNEEEHQLLLPFRGGLGGATTTTAAAFDVEDEDDKTLIGSLLP